MSSPIVFIAALSISCCVLQLVCSVLGRGPRALLVNGLIELSWDLPEAASRECLAIATHPSRPIVTCLGSLVFRVKDPHHRQLLSSRAAHALSRRFSSCVCFEALCSWQLVQSKGEFYMTLAEGSVTGWTG